MIYQSLVPTYHHGMLNKFLNNLEKVQFFNMHCFCTSLWSVDEVREHVFESMLTRLGSRVAQEMNFNHQKLDDGMVLRFLAYTTILSMIITYMYKFLSFTDRVPLINLDELISHKFFSSISFCAIYVDKSCIRIHSIKFIKTSETFSFSAKLDEYIRRIHLKYPQCFCIGKDNCH